jgi:hypothetical protein
MQVIIYTNHLGGVSVCVPTGEIPIEDCQRKDVPKGITSHIVENAALPYEDNDFFNAWEQTDGVVTVNLDKAKEITKTRLRTERKPLLAVQDLLFQRTLEAGGDTAAIVAEKQRLRDIPNLTDACATLADLRDLQP